MLTSSYYTMRSYTSLSNSLYVMHEVVGTVEGGRAPTKIKTDLKRPIVNLACHPRLPVLVHFHFPGIGFILISVITICGLLIGL